MQHNVGQCLVTRLVHCSSHCVDFMLACHHDSIKSYAAYASTIMLTFPVLLPCSHAVWDAVSKSGMDSSRTSQTGKTSQSWSSNWCRGRQSPSSITGIPHQQQRTLCFKYCRFTGAPRLLTSFPQETFEAWGLSQAPAVALTVGTSMYCTRCYMICLFGTRAGSPFGLAIPSMK